MLWVFSASFSAEKRSDHISKTWLRKLTISVPELQTKQGSFCFVYNLSWNLQSGFKNCVFALFNGLIRHILWLLHIRRMIIQLSCFSMASWLMIVWVRGMLTYNYEECKLVFALPAAFDLNYSQKRISLSKTSWCLLYPGTPDGTFPEASGFISHFSALKSEQSVFCVRSHTYCDLCI